MKVAHGVAHVLLTQPEAEALRVLWNDFTAEWNRRELDDGPRPCSTDAWSAIDTLGWLGTRTCVHFRPKGEPSWVWYRLTMQQGWLEFHDGWSFCKHPIAAEQLVRGERLIFIAAMHGRVFKDPDDYEQECRELVQRLRTEPDFWRTA